MNNYQQHELGKLLPQMSDEQYSIFKLDIQTNGFTTPLITIFEGKILDGWHRFRVSKELGIEIQTKEYDGDSPAHFVVSSCTRRDLTDGQKAVFGVEILPYIEKENSKQKSIKNVSTGSLRTSKVLSSDQRKSAYKAAKIVKSSVGSIQFVKKLEKKSPEIYQKVKSGNYSLADAKRNIKAIEKEEVRKELIEKSKGMIQLDRVVLKQGDCLELSKELSNDSISLIVTDPPYPEEFIDCWTKLSKIAMRVLKPSGFVIAYSGKLHLPEVIKRMEAEGLVYYWQFILLHKGLPAAVHGRKINTGYKPILVFQKPPFKQISNYCSDIIQGSGREKDGHEWQQGEDELKQIFDIFYNGGMVLEPFAGSGTTLSYCKNNLIPVIGYELNEDTYKIALSRIGEQIV